jgi:hypothetical protein
MAHCKTTQHKKVMRVQPRKHYEIDWMLERSSESHDNRRTADYFLRELRSLLRTLDYHAEPLYVGKKTPLRSKGYRWEVHFVLYEKPKGTRERCVRRAHHASAPSATFVAGIHDATRQALMIL